MESIPENNLLKLTPGAIQNIRKIHDLDRPGRLEEAIKIIRHWLQKEDHIIKKDFSDEYLERTLISCKGSVEKAKKQIDRLCTMRTLVPKFFMAINVKEELKDITDIAQAVPLPKITDDYYRVLLIKYKDKAFTSESFMLFYQYHVLLCEYIKANDYVNGFIVVHDWNNLNLLEVITKMNTVELQQFITILVEGFGARLKCINVLTSSKYIDMLIKTIKPFIPEKVGNRMQVRPTLEELHKHVPKEILPIEYGGNERSVDILHKEWIEAMSTKQSVEYNIMMRKACTDETKRRAAKFNEEYLGMPGSFRNLSVD